MIANPFFKELCLSEIDKKYVSNFTATDWDYYIITNRTQVAKYIPPYKYPSKVNISQINEFMCKNKTSMNLVSSPFSINGVRKQE